MAAGVVAAPVAVVGAARVAMRRSGTGVQHKRETDGQATSLHSCLSLSQPFSHAAVVRTSPSVVFAEAVGAVRAVGRRAPRYMVSVHRPMHAVMLAIRVVRIVGYRLKGTAHETNDEHER